MFPKLITFTLSSSIMKLKAIAFEFTDHNNVIEIRYVFRIFLLYLCKYYD